MPDIAAILKAFGQETRLRILRLISRQELAVNELVGVLEIPQPRASRQLAILRQVGLAQDRREGTWVYYRLDEERLAPPARAVWAAVAAWLDESQFAPRDLERLAVALARREARTKRYFQAGPSEWDRVRREYIDDDLSFVVVSSLVRPTAVVVDVGTGTGELLLSLAPTAAKVIGVDRSDEMLAVCRERLERSGLRNVVLRRGEAEALPLADGECDTAFSSMLLHHLGEPGRGVREMARVVRPGGRVVISDLTKHDCDWTREVMADVWLGFSEEQIRRWLTDAGLVDLTYSSTELPYPPRDGAQPRLGAFIATGTRPAE